MDVQDDGCLVVKGWHLLWQIKCNYKYPQQFSFYFESVLSQQATATDMKAICSRLQIDFVSLYVYPYICEHGLWKCCVVSL